MDTEEYLDIFCSAETSYRPWAFASSFSPLPESDDEDNELMASKQIKVSEKEVTLEVVLEPREEEENDPLFELRYYQDLIAAQAVHTNTIAYLPTGTGKTFIAYRIIDYRLQFVRLARDEPTEWPKIIVFVAPKKALLHQQIESVRKFCRNVKAEEFNSASILRNKKVDEWGLEEWRQQLQRYEVIGMTPAVLQGFVEKRLLPRDSIDLIVLDECHHATRNDPMAKLCDAIRSMDTKPLILGLTASPVKCKKADIRKAIEDLEDRMMSSFFLPTEKYIESINRFAFKPPTIVMEYPCLMDEYFVLPIIQEMEAAVTRLRYCDYIQQIYHADKQLEYSLYQSMCAKITRTTKKEQDPPLTYDGLHIIRECLHQTVEVAKTCGIYFAIQTLLYYLKHARTKQQMVTMKRERIIPLTVTIPPPPPSSSSKGPSIPTPAVVAITEIMEINEDDAEDAEDSSDEQDSEDESTKALTATLLPAVAKAATAVPSLPSAAAPPPAATTIPKFACHQLDLELIEIRSADVIHYLHGDVALFQLLINQPKIVYLTYLEIFFHIAKLAGQQVCRKAADILIQAEQAISRDVIVELLNSITLTSRFTPSKLMMKGLETLNTTFFTDMVIACEKLLRCIPMKGLKEALALPLDEEIDNKKMNFITPVYTSVFSEKVVCLFANVLNSLKGSCSSDPDHFPYPIVELTVDEPYDYPVSLEEWNQRIQQGLRLDAEATARKAKEEALQQQREREARQAAELAGMAAEDTLMLDQKAAEEVAADDSDDDEKEEEETKDEQDMDDDLSIADFIVSIKQIPVSDEVLEALTATDENEEKEKKKKLTTKAAKQSPVAAAAPMTAVEPPMPPLGPSSSPTPPPAAAIKYIAGATMVFTNMKVVAFGLNELFNQLWQGQNNIKSAALTGDMSIDNQRKVLAEFKQDQLNIVFATEIAEEGLDIKQCTTIIHFDGPKSVKAFIQRRGRARAQNSLTVHLLSSRVDAEELHDAQFNDLIIFKMEEIRIDDAFRSYTQSITKIIPASNGSSLAEERYMVPSTGAYVDHTSAQAAVLEFCQSIRLEDNTIPTVPFYTFRSFEDCILKIRIFVCNLHLPEILGYPIFSCHATKKQRGKGLAAIEAVEYLHDHSLLDDHLRIISNLKEKSHHHTPHEHEVANEEVKIDAYLKVVPDAMLPSKAMYNAEDNEEGKGEKGKEEEETIRLHLYGVSAMGLPRDEKTNFGPVTSINYIGFAINAGDAGDDDSEQPEEMDATLLPAKDIAENVFLGTMKGLSDVSFRYHYLETRSFTKREIASMQKFHRCLCSLHAEIVAIDELEGQEEQDEDKKKEEKEAADDGSKEEEGTECENDGKGCTTAEDANKREELSEKDAFNEKFGRPVEQIPHFKYRDPLGFILPDRIHEYPVREPIYYPPEEWTASSNSAWYLVFPLTHPIGELPGGQVAQQATTAQQQEAAADQTEGKVGEEEGRDEVHQQTVEEKKEESAGDESDTDDAPDQSKERSRLDMNYIHESTLQLIAFINNLHVIRAKNLADLPSADSCDYHPLDIPELSNYVFTTNGRNMNTVDVRMRHCVVHLTDIMDHKKNITYEQHYRKRGPITNALVDRMLAHPDEYYLFRGYQLSGKLGLINVIQKDTIYSVSVPHYYILQTCRPIGVLRWYYLMLLVPSIAYRFQSILLARECRYVLNQRMLAVRPPKKKEDAEDLLGKMPSLSMMLEAITSTRALECLRSERVEFLGDSFLKLAASLYVFIAHPEVGEGSLTIERKNIISNIFLTQIAQENAFYQYLRAIPMSKGLEELYNMPPGHQIDDRKYYHHHPSAMSTAAPGCWKDPPPLLRNVNTQSTSQQLADKEAQWQAQVAANPALLERRETPADYQSYLTAAEQRQEMKQLPGKVFADLMEALLSVCSLSDGACLGYLAMYALQIIPQDLQEMIEDQASYVTPGTAATGQKMILPLDRTSLQELEGKLQYTFSHKHLLGLATTHASMSGGYASYERLEFLGDAILDFIVARKYFSEQEDWDEGQLSKMKSYHTNNIWLSYHLQRFALLDYLRHNSSGITRMIQREKEGNGQENEGDVVHKINADLMEAVIGAVFLDSQCDLEVTSRVASLLGIFDVSPEEVEEARIKTELEVEMAQRAVEEGLIREMIIEEETVMMKEELLKRVVEEAIEEYKVNPLPPLQDDPKSVIAGPVALTTAELVSVAPIATPVDTSDSTSKNSNSVSDTSLTIVDVTSASDSIIFCSPPVAASASFDRSSSSSDLSSSSTEMIDLHPVTSSPGSLFSPPLLLGSMSSDVLSSSSSTLSSFIKVASCNKDAAGDSSHNGDRDDSEKQTDLRRPSVTVIISDEVSKATNQAVSETINNELDKHHARCSQVLQEQGKASYDEKEMVWDDLFIFETTNTISWVSDEEVNTLEESGERENNDY